MNSISVKIKRIDDRAVMPKYAHNGDVGMDLTAISVEYDEEHDAYVYHTGWAFESDFNIGQFIFPRSSNKKTDAYLTNSVGIGDSAIYRGEIMVVFKNRTSLEARAVSETFKMMNRNEHPNVDDVLSQYETHYESLLNAAKECITAPYQVGDRVAQMVFLFYPTVNLEIVDSLSDSDRGDGGFGSTGN